MTNYDHHFVNNPEGVNESQFDICDSMDDLLEVARNPNADQYEIGEAAGWIVQNYVDMRKERDKLRVNNQNLGLATSKVISDLTSERDALLMKVKQLEADLRGKNPPIWEGWSL